MSSKNYQNQHFSTHSQWVLFTQVNKYIIIAKVMFREMNVSFLHSLFGLPKSRGKYRLHN